MNELGDGEVIAVDAGDLVGAVEEELGGVGFVVFARAPFVMLSRKGDYGDLGAVLLFDEGDLVLSRLAHVLVVEAGGLEPQFLGSFAGREGILLLDGKAHI